MMHLKLNHNILYNMWYLYLAKKNIEELHMMKSNEITDINLG